MDLLVGTKNTANKSKRRKHRKKSKSSQKPSLDVPVVTSISITQDTDFTEIQSHSLVLPCETQNKICQTQDSSNICFDCSNITKPTTNNKGLLSNAVLNDYESACKVSELEVKHFFDYKGLYTYSSAPLSGNKEIPVYRATGPSACKAPQFISCAEQLIYTSPSTSGVVQVTNSNMSDKNNAQELSRDDVKAQREAKKAAKLAAKLKSKEKQSGSTSNGNKPEVLTKPNTSQQLNSSPKNITISQNSSLQESKSANITKEVKDNQKEAEEKFSCDKENVVDSNTKSKAQLRAERRAKQEQQRLAKAVSLTEKSKSTDKTTKVKTVERPADHKSSIEKSSKNERSKSKPSILATSTTKLEQDNVKATTLVHKVKLFNHLYRDNLSVTSPSEVHPAIFRLGVMYASGVVRGSNARCVALLNGLKHMVRDYTTPSEKEYSRGFEERLVPAMSYLNKCRPHSVSMNNALKYFKYHLTQLPNEITDTEARLKLKEIIETYIQEQVEMAGDAICMYVQKKITQGDIILTYGCSSLVEKILLTAHRNGTQFRAVVIDGGPWYEGKEMLRRLVGHQIECTYVLLSAVSFIMREVTKVIIGAHALLSNGAVMSRAGTAQVALVAQAFNVPVLAACETHKFCERVQTDSLVFNELGDPDELISDKSIAKIWKSLPNLTPLSLTYDVTPSHLVTAVITELAIVPCTSVPVVLRVKPTESQST